MGELHVYSSWWLTKQTYVSHSHLKPEKAKVEELRNVLEEYEWSVLWGLSPMSSEAFSRICRFRHEVVLL